MKAFRLRVEELTRRDVWSAAVLPGPDEFVVRELSLALPTTVADWRTVAVVTPDGVSHAADLTFAGTTLTARWDDDFALPAASVLTLRVGDAVASAVRYRELPVLVTAPPGDLTGAGTPAGDEFAVPTESPVSLVGVPGRLSVTADRPVGLTPGAARFEDGTTGLPPPPFTPPLTPPPPAPPVVLPTVPPAATPPPPVPPAGPSTVPPPVEPPRPTDRRPLSPVYLVGAQLDHRAGAFPTTANASPGPLATVAPPPTPTNDRITPAAWIASYTLLSGRLAASDELRERVRATLDPQPPVERTAGRNPRPAIRSAALRLDHVQPPVEPVGWAEGVLVESAPDPADVLLAKLAARPLPDAPEVAEAERPEEKKRTHLMSAFAALVMGGVYFRWFRSRPEGEPQVGRAEADRERRPGMSVQ